MLNNRASGAVLILSAFLQAVLRMIWDLGRGIYSEKDVVSFTLNSGSTYIEFKRWFPGKLVLPKGPHLRLRAPLYNK